MTGARIAALVLFVLAAIASLPHFAATFADPGWPFLLCLALGLWCASDPTLTAWRRS